MIPHDWVVAFLSSSTIIVLMLIVWAAQRAWRAFHEARKRFLRISQCVNVIALHTPQIVQAVNGLVLELAKMRAWTEAQAVQSGVDPNEVYQQQQTPETRPKPRGPMPFPGAPQERFTVIPDAKTGDTDMESLNQTDADLADRERLENMRQSGAYVDPEEEDNHEAVVAETT